MSTNRGNGAPPACGRARRGSTAAARLSTRFEAAVSATGPSNGARSADLAIFPSMLWLKVGVVMKARHGAGDASPWQALRQCTRALTPLKPCVAEAVRRWAHEVCFGDPAHNGRRPGTTARSVVMNDTPMMACPRLAR